MINVWMFSSLCSIHLLPLSLHLPSLICMWHQIQSELSKDGLLFREMWRGQKDLQAFCLMQQWEGPKITHTNLFLVTPDRTFNQALFTDIFNSLGNVTNWQIQCLIFGYINKCHDCLRLLFWFVTTIALTVQFLLKHWLVVALLVTAHQNILYVAHTSSAKWGGGCFLSEWIFEFAGSFSVGCLTMKGKNWDSGCHNYWCIGREKTK